jgi:hypothetical protein
MTQEVIIFNKVNEQLGFNYSGTQIASWSGLDKSLISRFVSGKTDISASKFLQLIRSMPTPFQQAYWAELLEPQELELQQGESWQSLISAASTSDIEEILNAIALRWAELGKSKEKELVTV